jgi:hypothetical protein
MPGAPRFGPIDRFAPAIAALLICASTSSSVQADVRDYAVEVSARVVSSPPSISFSWRPDPRANGYEVFKKAEADTAWSGPLARLGGSATTWADRDVFVGRAYEYSFRKTRGFVADTVTVAGGTILDFTIRDFWGDGICCLHGIGRYTVVGCGKIYAEGGEFGRSESVTFVAGGTDGACGQIIVSISLDYYGAETTWEIKDHTSGAILAQGGPYESPKYGHILAGIDVPALDDMGTVLLLVDQPVALPLAPELRRLEIDLIRDGYAVCRRDVPHDEGVPEVKERIKAECGRDPTIHTLLLFGNIAVPYSGNITEGHEDHVGAWPADTYYGDLDGIWTDDTVDNTTAARGENQNVPGDGKFDQSILPSDVDLQVGRIDLSRLSAFSIGEIGLLKRYLDKDHAFRGGEVTTVRRGLVTDRFGEAGGAAYAAVGWRTFAPMFGPSGVGTGAWLPTLVTRPHLCAYGCGPGSYTECGDVISTGDFAYREFQTIFTMLFGSYFGDWDNPNNVLRAALASKGRILTCCWASRPAWSFHHMALGYPIGTSARITQNNVDLYMAGDGSREVHTALMGDPTLKMCVVRPPRALRLDAVPPGRIRLAWSPPADSVIGYRIYRSGGIRGRFVPIDPAALADTTYLDGSPAEGWNVYSVRAVKRERTSSGTFFNLSPGAIDSLFVEPCADPQDFQVGMSTAPNPFRNSVSISLDLGCSTWATLGIFDSSGRRVRTIDLGPQTRGTYSVTWDGADDGGRDLPRGIYIVRLVSGKGTVSRKTVRLG